MVAKNASHLQGNADTVCLEFNTLETLGDGGKLACFQCPYMQSGESQVMVEKTHYYTAQHRNEQNGCELLLWYRDLPYNQDVGVLVNTISEVKCLSLAASFYELLVPESLQYKEPTGKSHLVEAVTSLYTVCQEN